MSLVELLAAVSLISLLVTATATFSVPWLARESMRGAVYDVQTFLLLARTEAVTRNYDCRFVVEAGTRTIRVLDTNGTPGDTSDDQQLHETTLPSAVTFADPESNPPITLTEISARTYQAVFSSDGAVSDGIGVIALFGGDRYTRISLLGAGGTLVERWNGYAWSPGS